MNCDCCAQQPAGNRPAGVGCPACHSESQPVESHTVAALILGSVPRRQRFWLCRSRDCEVVYFGDSGARLLVSELRFLPAFKSESPEALVCYCFLHRRSEIETELRHSGTSTVGDRIAIRVQARECECEVRNPSGRCCLGEVKAETDQLRAAILT
jgi:hypothetical protein